MISLSGYRSWLAMLWPVLVLLGILCAGLRAVEAAPGDAPRPVMVIVDHSGSMWKQVGKQDRVIAVRKALAPAFSAYEGRIRLGISSFGHGRVATCGGAELLLAPGEIDPVAYSEALEKIRPKGASSVVAALSHAALTLDHTSNAGSIVLIADGADNCEQDACAMARELMRTAKDLRIHVVALDVESADEIAGLRCIAGATGGEVLTASTQDELTRAVDRAFAAAASDNERTSEVALNPLSASPQSPHSTGEPDQAAAKTPAQPDTGTMSTKRVSKGPPPRPLAKPKRIAALAPPQPIALAPAPKADDALITGSTDAPPPAMPESAGAKASNEALLPETAAPRRPAMPDMPADDRLSRLRHGLGGATAPAGDAPEFILVRAAAEKSGIVLSAKLTRKLAVIRRPLQWSVFRIDPTDPRKWKTVAEQKSPQPSFDLPPGDYVVKAAYGNAAASKVMTVSARTVTTALFILNAGALKVSPALARLTTPEGTVSSQAVYAEVDAAPGQKPLVLWSRPDDLIRLNAGNYRLVSKIGADNTVLATTVTIRPGRLTEVEVNHKAGIVRFRLIDKASGAPLGEAVWQVLDAEGNLISQTEAQEPSHVLKPGRYTINARIGEKAAKDSFDITAGESKIIDVYME